MQKKDDSFKDFILDQLYGLEGVTARALFGGHGLYRGGTFSASSSKADCFSKRMSLRVPFMSVVSVF